MKDKKVKETAVTTDAVNDKKKGRGGKLAEPKPP